jgi:hypothetical protein
LRPFVRTSREVHFATGSCMQEESADYWVPAVRRGRRFRPRRRFCSSAVPRPFRNGFIPSCVLSSSESSRLPSSRLAALPALGFLPSSRRYRWCPRFAGFPTSRFVPSSGFLNLSTAFSTFGVAGLFHPAATSRVSVQGFGPDSQPYRFVIGRASLPLSQMRSPVARLPHIHDRASRLCSAGPGRSSESAVNLLRCRSPLRLFLLQALPPASRPHAVTAHGLRS